MRCRRPYLEDCIEDVCPGNQFSPHTYISLNADTSEPIFVTGASGFLGSHVVLQLLEKALPVAGKRTSSNHPTHCGYGDRFEVVKMADIAHNQLPEAFIGVSAVMHLASPLPDRAEPAELLEAAVEGTLNVQAEKAGVRRMVVTSSIATVKNPQESYTDKGRFRAPAKRLTSLRQIGTLLHVDVTTLYNFLFPEGVFSAETRYARQICLRSVHRPRPRWDVIASSSLLRRGGPSSSPWTSLPQRTALKARLVTSAPKVLPADVLPLDFNRVEEGLGMKIADFQQPPTPSTRRSQQRSDGEEMANLSERRHLINTLANLLLSLYLILHGTLAEVEFQTTATVAAASARL
ncbi:hypothetical protein GGX14DRAFT_651159 [Mycena pura]|uniref:NAD-dependent epimerase/dehydratase domain-containing protein n=1 Tax=Mycena pura TaxID=153505 RepID=A0AAD7E311_9AGAR|nr:hypothetical protein GGX14DRAFT_651159 [Mycena pura]